jgi:hypothetical protein
VRAVQLDGIDSELRGALGRRSEGTGLDGVHTEGATVGVIFAFLAPCRVVRGTRCQYARCPEQSKN